MVFAIHQSESAMGVHVSPPSWDPFPFPPHPFPPGCHRPQVLGALHHTSDLHWPSVLRTVMCMFQCYSLKSSHPLLLALNPKACFPCFLCCPYTTLELCFSSLDMELSWGLGPPLQLHISPGPTLMRKEHNTSSCLTALSSFPAALSWLLHSIQTNIPTPLLLHKTCLLFCHHLQNSNNKSKTI